MAYSISTAFAIYFVLWWIVLFLTLPFGVAQPARGRRGCTGTDPGAPIRDPYGPQADLDHGDIGHHFRQRDAGLQRGLFQYRAAVEADGDSALSAGWWGKK